MVASLRSFTPHDGLSKKTCGQDKELSMIVGPVGCTFADRVNEVTDSVFSSELCREVIVRDQMGPLHVGAHGFHVKDGASGCVLMKFMPKSGVRQTHRVQW